MSIFGKSLINLNPSIFGLDVCDRSMKAIELQRSRKKTELKSFSYGEVPAGLVDNGEIKDTKKLGEIISGVMANARPFPIKVKNVVCSVVESRCFVRVVNVPFTKEEELEDAINLEAEEYFPLSREEMYIDWQVICGNALNVPKCEDNSLKEGEKLKVLIGAAPKSLVDSYLETLSGCGLNPVAIEMEPVATVRCLVDKNYGDKNVLIIDLGGQRTSFIIARGEAIYFTSGISVFCGDVLTSAIARELKVSLEDAMQIKNTCGFDRNRLEGKMFKILNPYISELIMQVRKVIAYYMEHSLEFSTGQRNNNIGKIILCGGGASLIGLDIFMAQQLKIPVEIGNPWINIFDKSSKKIPSISRDKSLYFSTAIGLAMQNIK